METENIKFNIAKIITCSEVEGPFKRLTIWFQGCDINCSGCCNQELQKFKVSHILTFDEVLEIILKSKEENQIEGVTFSGGEPSLQRGLFLLGQKLRKLDIGTIMFSGHYVQNLDRELVESMDLIIEGPFKIDKLDKKRRLIGSTNQKITLITERYSKDVIWFFKKNSLLEEVNITDRIEINGDAI